MSATQAPRIAERDRAIVDRYTDQPTRLPADLRARIERSWGGEPVQLYALTDLDPRLSLTERWIAVGPTRVAIARRSARGTDFELTHIDRERVSGARETPGMSCYQLALLGEADEPPLAVLRYTHRQRRAVDAVRALIETSEVADNHDADEAYADHVATPIREAQMMVAKTDMAVLFRLLGYLRPYKRHLVFGFGAAALITALSLVPAYLAGYVIDDVVRPAQDGSLSGSRASTVAWIVVAAIAVTYGLRSLLSWVRLRFMAVLGEYVARDLRTELFEHLQRLSLSFFSRKKTGSLITRVSSDTDRLWDFLAFGVVDVSLSLVMLIGLGAVLIGLDWRLGLVMTVPVPLLIAMIFFHGRRLEAYCLRAWRRWSQLTDVLSDTIPGMRVVKAFNQEDREIERFEGRNEGAAQGFNDIHRVWTSFWPLLMLGIHGLSVAVWALALPRLLGDSAPALSAGELVSFLLYTGMFVAPIEVLGQVSRVMNRATSSAHRIFEVLDTEPEVVDRHLPRDPGMVRGDVHFDTVSFSYDGVRTVLHGVDLEVRAGEMIGLVGPSGGGKTTMVNLLARFYDPVGGAVRVDGVDLRDLDSGAYRRQVGMVLQDPYLFHGTIADNIRYGVADADEQRVIEAARAANAHDFICKLPHGYDTVVGERGHTLSGGERQRVSIARAVLHDPRILILDEATSSVDTESERIIEEAMHRLIGGRTVFAIAHRLSTLRRADRIVVIEDGRTTEIGTHEELLAKPDGTYRRLSDLQREVAA